MDPDGWRTAGVAGVALLRTFSLFPGTGFMPPWPQLANHQQLWIYKLSSFSISLYIFNINGLYDSLCTFHIYNIYNIYKLQAIDIQRELGAAHMRLEKLLALPCDWAVRCATFLKVECISEWSMSQEQSVKMLQACPNPDTFSILGTWLHLLSGSFWLFQQALAEAKADTLFLSYLLPVFAICICYQLQYFPLITSIHSVYDWRLD